MKKYILLFLLLVNINLVLFAQEVSGIHKIEKGHEESEYSIKTEISGLKGVDIARVIYKIVDKHTYKKSPNNSFFSDRKNNEVKFYIMGVPSTGTLNIEFNITIDGNGSFNFPCEIQYSKNEEKKVFNLPPINISNELLAANEEGNSDNGKEENKAAQEQAEKKQQEKLLAEQKAKEEEMAKQKQEAEKAAKEQAEKEQQEKLLAEQKAKEEEIAKQKQEAEITTKGYSNTSGKTYTVQILSLSNYSASRISYFCKKHNLSENDIIKRNVDGFTKISIGKVNSQKQATALQQKLATENNINQSFIVTLP